VKPTPAPKAEAKANANANAKDNPCVVCIGASAGGLEALEKFFGGMPANSGAAFVVIVHLAPDYKSMMSELIARHTAMPVTDAQHDVELRPNNVYIIPPRKNLSFLGRRIILEEQDRSEGHGLNLPIDLALHSLSECASTPQVAVILSGTGSDGSRGIRAIKNAGGVVLAQTPESAKFDGMPHAALESGCVDMHAAPDELARTLASLLESGLPVEVAVDGHDQTDPGDTNRILNIIKGVTGVDLDYFRRPMLGRRISRRMALCRAGEIGEYIERLEADVNEVWTLLQDMFVGVTNFFRDPEAFDALKSYLVREFTSNDERGPYRVWVPACATGEEVYSLAIVIQEAMAEAHCRRDIQIFATDIDEQAVTQAGRAMYTLSNVAGLTPERLSRHFVNQGDSFVVSRSTREMVICARHNLVSDPPFTKIDLVSCRNFLIYVEKRAHDQVLASLHFALKKGGLLFLGSAEVIGHLADEFDELDAKRKIFRKIGERPPPHLRWQTAPRDPSNAIQTRRAGDRDDAYRQVIDAIVEKENKSAFIVRADGSLVEMICDPLGVMRAPKGRPTSDAVRMAGRDVGVAIGAGLQRIRRGAAEASYSVDLKSHPDNMTARVVLKLLPASVGAPDRAIVLVEPVHAATRADMADFAFNDEAVANRINELQSDLYQTRESLQATIEELQSSNEEQQSTNEELVASNEELQSTNEELQSLNEELHTVNDEYQKKNRQLVTLAADLDNLLRSIEVGALFLDRDMCIRKCTPGVERVVDFQEADIGRNINFFAHQLGADFESELEQAVADNTPAKVEFRGPRGEWLLLRILPYRNDVGENDGAVLSLVDITSVKNVQEMTRLGNAQLEYMNTQLGRQKDELEDLFSIVAHDLRQPVVSLNGLLDIVREDVLATTDGDAGSIVDKALAECRRMGSMLDDLSHVAKITREDVPLVVVEIQPWLDEMVERYLPRAVSGGVTIHRACDKASIRIPRIAVEEAFMNLVENALKYGCTNASPRIDVVCQVLGGEFLLSVSDNGKGIPRNQLERIFEPFSRLEPSVVEGTGVGLMAVRRLVRKHGGVVRVESEPEQGAKFTIRLPLSANVSGSGADEATKPRILLVEDERLDAKIVEHDLADLYAVTTVRGIREAEDRLKNETFRLVMLDLSLPDGHGFELVRNMRSTLDCDTPVVVISGRGEGLSTDDFNGAVVAFLDKATMGRESIRRTVEDSIKSPGVTLERRADRATIEGGVSAVNRAAEFGRG